MCKRGVLRHLIQSVFFISIWLPLVRAQEVRRSTSQERLNLLPGGLDRLAASLGIRLMDTNKERSVLTGNLTSETGDRVAIKIILQLPAMVRIEGLRSDGSPVIFDGTGIYPNSRLEEELLEVFSSDTMEGLLASVNGGAAVQLVGRRVLSARDRSGNHDSTRFDIYEVSGAVLSNARGVERLKRYLLDSETGLLYQTHYVDDTFAPPLNVVTEFSGWRIVNGSAYPETINRIENGRTAFSFAVTSIEALPRLDPNTFGSSAQKKEE